MSEDVRQFVDNLTAGENNEAGEAFKSALRGKVGDALDAKRKEMASNMFTQPNEVPTEVETFSDPKPEIAEPGTFDRDGNVVSQNDGQADIDLSADENK